LFIDSYVPLYCSWTKKLIEPNSKGHLIINIRCLNTKKELNKRIIAIVIATSIRSQGFTNAVLSTLMSKF